MEFTNEIFFNKNLIADETVIITYSGKLYREHSAQVYIVYGFGDNWDYTTELPMKETENGFEVTIELKNYNTLNFCFKNDYNIWDNNNTFNYIATISQKQTPINNSNTKTDISNSTTSESAQENDNKDEESQEQNQANSDETSENNTENIEITKDEEIEAVFSSLLDSILDMTPNETVPAPDINTLDGFGLQAVDEIKEENFVDCDDIFKEFYEELSTIPTETVENNVEGIETANVEEIIENSAKETENAVTEEVIENNTTEEVKTSQEFQEEPQKNTYDNFTSEELDKLMDNILSSMIQSEENKNGEKAETASTNSDTENASLPAVVNNDTFLDTFIEVSFNFFKKVEIGCKKLAALIKLKAKELGLIK